MIAHLGMYDAGPANDALWIAIRRELGFGPDALTQADDYWDVWQSPDLLLSQTCGYPFRARLHDQVQLVGTPDYGVEGCDPGFYHSVILARDPKPLTDMQGARFAFNEALSQSGWAGPMQLLGSTGITPGALVQTGSHAGSINAVCDGEADFAAIDVVTWALVERSGLEAADMLSVIGKTEAVPGLPLITGTTQNAETIASAVTKAIAKLPPQTRKQLMLKGLVQIPAQTYLDVPSPPSPPEMQIPIRNLTKTGVVG